MCTYVNASDELTHPHTHEQTLTGKNWASLLKKCSFKLWKEHEILWEFSTHQLHEAWNDATRNAHRGEVFTITYNVEFRWWLLQKLLGNLFYHFRRELIGGAHNRSRNNLSHRVNVNDMKKYQHQHRSHPPDIVFCRLERHIWCASCDRCVISIATRVRDSRMNSINKSRQPRRNFRSSAATKTCDN